MLIRYLASASMVALGAFAAPALAQDATEDDTARSDTQIIVTATRREENIQDVPLSISAFGQEELTKKGIVGFEGIGRETPGVILNRPT